MYGKLEDLAGEFESLESCCLHEPRWRPLDAAEVLVWRWESPDDYGSTEQVILVRLKDGGFGLLTSSSDTTGHGCQCGSHTVRADTLAGLLAHLTEYELLDLLRDREAA
jgi:hypothetical protein